MLVFSVEYLDFLLQAQMNDPYSTINLFKKLLKLRTESPALQTSTIKYAVVNTEIFSFLRVPDEEDAENSSILVAINFSSRTIIADYTLQLEKKDVIFKDYGGIVAMSSNLDQEQNEIDLRTVVLKPNEALVINVLISMEKSFFRREMNFIFTSISILIPFIFYFLLQRIETQTI